MLLVEGFDVCLDVRCTDPCVTSVLLHVVTCRMVVTLGVTVHQSALHLLFCASARVVSLLCGYCVRKVVYHSVM